MTPNPLVMGPVESAAERRAPEVRAAARWLDVTPAVAERGGAAMGAAQAFAGCAVGLLHTVSVDTPELVRALLSLTSAKDEAVRAAIAGGR